MIDVLQGSDTIFSAGARDDLRLRALRALEANPELSQRELAQKLCVSLCDVNYATKSLVERGFVKVGNFRKADNKGAYMCLLIPKGIAEKTSLVTGFLGRKFVECEG